MDDQARLKSLIEALNQADEGLYFVPIRHHSPACAWAVRELIREIKPRQILIESPIDLESHIPVILAQETRPPVALAVLIERKEQSRLAAYYPYCSHSPEYVALVEGHKINADLKFIDLPSADKAMLSSPSPDEVVIVDGESYFDSGDFIKALCTKTGCRNGFELWDHLFESKLGNPDWRSFLADVGSYCAALRQATPTVVIDQNGDLDRERHMSEQALSALEQEGPVVVITGGFHTSAMIDTIAKRQNSKAKPKRMAKTKTGKNKVSTEPAKSYLIRYGFKDLDALSGYAAGLPQPGYYDYLWNRVIELDGAPQWKETALDLISLFSQRLREQGHSINVPAQVEAIRVAEGLASMRGREGASRYDLIDGVRTALVKGEVGQREIWTEKLLEFLRGDAIGDVPASAGSPPIVEDARSRAARLRIDLSDGSRRKRRLDIRRKPTHLAASRFFYAMEMLETKFANRLMGPDFINGVSTDRLFEEWEYSWSPLVEGRLIELAYLGDSVSRVCLALLFEQKKLMSLDGKSRDIAGMADLFVQGILAGLDKDLAPFLTELAHDIQAHGDFTAVAQTLRRLHNIDHASGLLQISPQLKLNNVWQASYRRLIYLCDDLPKTPEEAVQERIKALRLMMELLRAPGSEQFDRSLFEEAVNRVADAKPPPEILGSVLAISVRAEFKSYEDICVALRGSFSGTVVDEKDRIGVLRGMLYTTPEILWRSNAVLEETDRLLCELNEEDFLHLLPHIRLAFTSLNPRESDKVAGSLARLHGGQAPEFAGQQLSITEHDLQNGIVLEKTLAESLRSDGLTAWIEEGV